MTQTQAFPTEPSRTASAPANPRGRVELKPKAEEVFRGLWASLFLAGSAKRKSVLVCSADRQEGATTVAAGLAVAGAQGGAGVVLADFNLRQPGVHEMLDLPEGPGLCDVLNGAVPLSQAVRTVGDLSVLTVGSGRQRVLEMLRGDRVSNFIHELCQRYAHVIVDCASVNAYPDAVVLGETLKDVVLVADSSRTPREAVAQALKRIESSAGRVVGTVLNKRTFPIPKFLYRRV